MNNHKVIQSHVFHGEKAWFVSTIERDSSAMIIPPPRFNETMVWAWDDELRERGDAILLSSEDIPGSIRDHVRICKHLSETGELPPEE